LKCELYSEKTGENNSSQGHIMGQKTSGNQKGEKRSEQRKRIDQYYSVEFLIKDLGRVYQFKIWDLSSKGMCILVKDDSKVLEHLKVGEVVKMKYYHAELLNPVEHFETEVKHITKEETGRFKGHHMIGLSINNNSKTDPEKYSV